jgi:hypothetical protein
MKEMHLIRLPPIDEHEIRYKKKIKGDGYIVAKKD